MSKNFCSIPWIHAATTTSGASRVCCLMSNHSSGGLTGHNFKNNTIEEIHNSEFTRKIRKQFLAGETPEECSTCWIKEASGGKSRRTFTNKIYKDIINYDKAKAATDADGYTSIMPVYWDLRFGNLCNLKCVMCGPQSSSQWYKDWAHVYNTDEFLDSGKIIKFTDKDAYTWWDTENFWNQLNKNINNLSHIYLVGGEPTLIEQHYDFLQTLVDKDLSKNITLEYDTNITNVHERALEQWKNFKNIMLRVSIDDYGKQNDYIRFPSKWQSVSRNIDIIKERLPNTKIEISITWQILNSFTFLNLLDEFSEEYINIRILSHPEFMDVKNISANAKTKLIELYTARNDVRLQPLINYLNSTLDYENYDNIIKLEDFLSSLDTQRNTNWNQTFPELYKMINT